MHFATVLNDSTVQFDMLNGKDLTSNEYLSISTARQVTDQAHKNYPDDNNRKVAVYIQPVPPDRIVPVPILRPYVCTPERLRIPFCEQSRRSELGEGRQGRHGAYVSDSAAGRFDPESEGYIKIYDVIGQPGETRRTRGRDQLAQC